MYPSMPCRFPGPHPRGTFLARGVSRSTPVQAHTHPGGCIPACTEADPPPAESCERYASYWNTFFLILNFILTLLRRLISWRSDWRSGTCLVPWARCLGAATTSSLPPTTGLVAAVDRSACAGCTCNLQEQRLCGKGNEFNMKSCCVAPGLTYDHRMSTLSCLATLYSKMGQYPI